MSCPFSASSCVCGRDASTWNGLVSGVVSKLGHGVLFRLAVVCGTFTCEAMQCGSLHSKIGKLPLYQYDGKQLLGEACFEDPHAVCSWIGRVN